MNKFLAISIAALSIVLFGGCNVGSVPEGMSENDAKAAIEKMAPEEKIRFYASSPMSQAEKEQKYKEIEASTGVKAADVLAGGTAGGNPSGR